MCSNNCSLRRIGTELVGHSDKCGSVWDKVNGVPVDGGNAFVDSSAKDEFVAGSQEVRMGRLIRAAWVMVKAVKAKRPNQVSKEAVVSRISIREDMV